MIGLLELPKEILVNIFTYLKLQDLRNLILSCKYIHNIVINDNILWKSLSRHRLFICGSTNSSKSNRLSWYNRCRVSRNWCNGIYKTETVVHHHKNYMPWLNYYNSEVLLLTVGSELRCYAPDKKGFPTRCKALWNITVPKVRRNDVRTNDISRFIIKNGVLVCGNRDGSTAVYQYNSIKSKPQLIQHIENCHDFGQVEVSAVEIFDNNKNNFVITASYHSPNVLFWHWNKDDKSDLYPNGYLEDVMDIQINEEIGVKCLAVNRIQDKLAMGLNGNNRPLLMDVSIGKLLMTAEKTRSVKNAVRDIQWHNDNLIVYVTHSGILQLTDIRNQQVVYDCKEPFLSTLYCVKSDGKHAIIAGSSEYSRCILYDLRNSKHHNQIYFTQKRSSPVYSLDFDSTKLIAAVDRGMAVLNFNISTSSVQRRDYSDVFH